MTLDELKDKVLGKSIEFHSFGTGALNQCVDLVNYYINHVLDNSTKDYTEIIGTNAKDFKTKYDPDDFEWIKNTTDAIIKKGDIAVWNGNVGGGAGHVAIALEDGTLSSFKSLDQNWSKKELVTIENHNYNNVDGWLRPKNVAQTITIETSLFEKLVGNSTKYDEFVNAGYTSVEVIKDIEAKSKEKDIVIDQKSVKIAEQEKEIEKLKKELETANIEAKNLRTQVKDLTKIINDTNENDSQLAETLLETQKEVTSLKTQLEGKQILINRIAELLKVKEGDIVDTLQENQAPVKVQKIKDFNHWLKLTKEWLF